LDLARTFLLGLREISREILEISAFFSFDGLPKVVLLVCILLNCKDTYCLKVLFSQLAISLFQPDSYIKERNFQAAKLNSEN